MAGETVEFGGMAGLIQNSARFDQRVTERSGSFGLQPRQFDEGSPKRQSIWRGEQLHKGTHLAALTLRSHLGGVSKCEAASKHRSLTLRDGPADLLSMRELPYGSKYDSPDRPEAPLDGSPDFR